MRKLAGNMSQSLQRGRKFYPSKNRYVFIQRKKIIPFFVYRDAGGKRGLLRTNKYR